MESDRVVDGKVGRVGCGHRDLKLVNMHGQNLKFVHKFQRYGIQGLLGWLRQLEVDKFQAEFGRQCCEKLILGNKPFLMAN